MQFRLSSKKIAENYIKNNKSFRYPNSGDSIEVQTFKINYKKKLSSIAKLILNNFRNKHLYYAIDDIIYLLKHNSIERDNLLSILYSPVISLQNNQDINFFDIWIDTIYIDEIPKFNKFINKESENFEQSNYIIIRFFYKINSPIVNVDLPW